MARTKVLEQLADPRVRLGAGVASLGVTAAMVRRDRVGNAAALVFHAVNDLPDALFPPAWAVMQLGNVGAAPGAALVALAVGERRLARRLFVCGTASWALSKVVKRGIRRPRPAALLPDTRRRGPDAAGLGYLSGHAAVVMAMGIAALPRLRVPGRRAVLLAVPVVGACRMYVGAHLPLDVVGGVALGLAVEGALEVWSEKLNAGGGAPVEAAEHRERAGGLRRHRLIQIAVARMVKRK
jgi:membrane-associated phospholipid phosphatase